MLELPLPLFNQGQPAVAAAEARLRQSQRRYAAMAVEIRAEVRRARNDLLAARDLADYYARVIVPLRHQIVRAESAAIQRDAGRRLRVAAGKQAEIDAGREYVEALQGYWVARAELERAVGGRLAAGDGGRHAAGRRSQPADPLSPRPRPPAAHHHHHGE